MKTGNHRKKDQVRMFRSILVLLLAGCASTTGAHAEPSIAHVSIRLLFPQIPASGAAPALSALPDKIVNGSATYLGQGRFLTAAHLISGKQTYDRKGEMEERARITTDGETYLAGSPSVADYDLALDRYPSQYLDLAVLPVPPTATARLDDRAARLCDHDLGVGEAVTIASSLGATTAHIAPPVSPGYATLDVVAQHGDSGGGVFAADGCLAGVVSSDWPDDPGVKGSQVVKTNSLVVPVSVVRAFLAAAFR